MKRAFVALPRGNGRAAGEKRARAHGGGRTAYVGNEPLLEDGSEAGGQKGAATGRLVRSAMACRFVARSAACASCAHANDHSIRKEFQRISKERITERSLFDDTKSHNVVIFI